MIRHFLLAVLAACGMLTAAEWRIALKNSPQDYGSGSLRASLYYPGGIPNVGTFIGHANSTTRDDRVLLRFDITRFYMCGRTVEIEKTWVEFKGMGIHGPVGDRKIYLDHCDYDRTTMSREDLANDKVTRVMEDTPEGNKVYHADVTSQLKDDIANFRFHSMYRVSDSCGLKTNSQPNAIGQGIRTYFEGPSDIPVLVVIVKD